MDEKEPDDEYLCPKCEKYVLDYVAEKRKKDAFFGKYAHALESEDMKDILCQIEMTCTKSNCDCERKLPPETYTQRLEGYVHEMAREIDS